MDHVLVPLERVFASKLFPARVALEIFFSRVDEKVSFEKKLRLKEPSTERTRSGAATVQLFI